MSADSDNQSARALLIELERRSVVPSGMDTQGVLATLGELETMQQQGWKFIPPKERT